MNNIYSCEITTLDGKKTNLQSYSGKVLLIVNTASRCGFTPQYKGLQQLFEEFSSQGLVVLGFPCNQFGYQEPGNEEEIREFCSTNFKITFPIFSKIRVNGPGTHPLYKILKKKAPGLLGMERIPWNFTKFLISRYGNKIVRFSPNTRPEKLTPLIKKYLLH
jgi:glutathione peroxidase